MPNDGSSNASWSTSILASKSSSLFLERLPEGLSSNAASCAAAASMFRHALTAAPLRGVPLGDVGDVGGSRDLFEIGDCASFDRASGLTDARPRLRCDGVGDASGLEGVLALVMTGEGLPAPRLAGDLEAFLVEAATMLMSWWPPDN